MSGVRLKPMDGGSDIMLSDGKTTIGRGPLMKQVTDKRMSRLHAVAEVNTNQVTAPPVDELGLSDKGMMGNVEKKEDMNGQAKEHQSYDERGPQVIPNMTKNEQEITSTPIMASFNGSNEKEKFGPINLQGIDKDQEEEGEGDHFPINPVIADPQDNARKLPGWMKSASSPTRQQKTSDLDEDEEQDVPQRRGRRDEDYDADFVVDDFDIDEEEDDDETAPKSRKRKQPAQKKKTSPKGKKPKFAAVYSSGEEDIGEDSEEESDEWTPNQRRKTPKANRSKTKPRQRTPKKETPLPKAEPFIDYERVATGVTSSSRIELSEEEEEEVDDQTGELKRDQLEEEDSDGSDRLPPCPYGLKCYRRNVHHFEEYSHPPGHQLGGVESDKPECPYGIKCLRSNPTHRKEYTHTQPPATARSGRPKRDSTSRKGDSDDDVNALYEYDDSWLDASESSESYQDDPDDSDWEPEGVGQGSGGGGGADDFDEDVTELVAEARSFLRNKRN